MVFWGFTPLDRSFLFLILSYRSSFTYRPKKIEVQGSSYNETKLRLNSIVFSFSIYLMLLRKEGERETRCSIIFYQYSTCIFKVEMP